MRDLIKRSDVIEALKPIAELLSYGLQSDIASALMGVPVMKTKRIKYFDEAEMVWKIGSVIVE